MFESRRASEEQAMSYTQIQNRMSSAALSDLLDARKDVKSIDELQRLAKAYAVDFSLLTALAKVVNSPSVGEKTTVRGVENGEEKVTSKVRSASPLLPNRLRIELTNRCYRRSGLTHQYNVAFARSNIYELCIHHPCSLPTILLCMRKASYKSSSAPSYPKAKMFQKVETHLFDITPAPAQSSPRTSMMM